jgi:hypothetical protein
VAFGYQVYVINPRSVSRHRHEAAAGHRQRRHDSTQTGTQLSNRASRVYLCRLDFEYILELKPVSW